MEIMNGTINLWLRYLLTPLKPLPHQYKVCLFITDFIIIISPKQLHNDSSEHLVIFFMGIIFKNCIFTLQDPKRHLEEHVDSLMNSNIVQCLGAMLDTVVFQ